jgi:hypothetical protein
MYECRTLKLVKVVLRKKKDKMEHTGRDEPTSSILYAYMGTSKQNLLYNYYEVIKTFNQNLPKQ